MQWLIDLIKEWVQAQGYLTTGYVHRPCANGWDFSLADYTRDGFWHELDLSSIVPAGAKAVHIIMRLKCGTVAQGASFATPGENVYGCYHTMYTVVGVMRYGETFVITPSAARKILYHFSVATWSEAYTSILGWWL